MAARILFVDEEPEFLRAHIDTLKEAGYNIEQAYSYSEALDALRMREFDLIILDLILPPDESDERYITADPSAEVGLDLHRAIREDLRKTKVPIIFFTVSGETDTRRQIQSVEMNYGQRSTILVKPKLPSQLLVQVRKLTGK